MATEKEVRTWLTTLNKALDARIEGVSLFRAYYEGHHRPQFATDQYREQFGWLVRGVRINFCVLVVDSARERLSIDGFRIGEDEDNREAWRIWQANKLDARSDIAHTEALVTGLSHLIVGPNSRRSDTPRISVEDALTTVVATDPEDVDIRAAALKRFVDEDGFERAWLYLPDAIYTFRGRTQRRAPYIGTTTRGEDYWEPWGRPDQGWPMANPLGEVPVIPLVNNPTVQNFGQSELQSVLPIQDMLNKLASDLIVASEFVAYPQRYATGIEVPTDANGRPVEPFNAGAGRIWMTEGENVRFGQFPEGSLAPYVSAIEMFTQQIATITKTPPHYLLGQSGNFPSGESLKATETGLVSKVRQEQRFFGESWEEAMRLAMRLAGHEVINPESSEVVWRDPENRVQSERTDSVLKEASLGVPFEFQMERLGYTQVQIERMKVMRLQESLEQPLTIGVVPDANAA